MTPKEKMMGGYLYHGDEGLFNDRVRAKRLIALLNATDPGDLTGRRGLMKELFGQEVGSAWIEPPFVCDYGYNIHIGKGFFANHGCVILDCAEVHIGDNVLFAPNVSIYTAGHPLNPDVRRASFEYALPVTIGDDVWVGGNTVINPGVTIGSRVVIGSGSVVTHDIPDDCVAAGNPCRVIRHIDKDTKEKFRIAEEDAAMIAERFGMK